MSNESHSTAAGKKRNLRWVGEGAAGSAAYYKKSWALVIGIDDYRDQHPRLANAVNDAREMARVLKEEYGFDHVFTLYDQEASRNEILG